MSDHQEDAWDFDGTRRHYIRLGLRLTHAERLRWLEETVDEMRQLQGLARTALQGSATLGGAAIPFSRGRNPC